MVFPSLDVFSGVPKLALLDEDESVSLTMRNAAKQMRKSIKAFQELTNLRVAILDG